MDERLFALEESLRRLRSLTIALAMVLLALVGWVLLADATPEVVRARGFIVVDDQGRERILIGAPIPGAANRVRTDSMRAREMWAGRFPDPDQYMGFYAGYDHSMNGVLILDEQGMDRLALGDPTPDPNIGRRLAPATGLQINDADGFERSGYGLLTVEGTDRVVLGLDSNRGTEALTLTVRDDGRVGLSIGAQGESIFLGRAGFASAAAELVIRRGDTIVYSSASDEGR